MNAPYGAGRTVCALKIAPKEKYMKTVTIYTDGACSGNPGPGGWGAILMYGPHKKELSGGAADTTNNRMELTGVISALRALKEPCVVELYSDSKYVIDALEKGWAKEWRARGWVKGDKKPALNPDLWQQLLELCDQDFVPPLSHRNSTSQTNWAETEEKTDGIAEYLENICSQHVVLWKKEGVVRAFMTWKDHFNCENLEAYPDSCYLTTLCVWPDYRGQGISEVMYAEAEKDIAAKFPGSRITLRTWSTNGAQEHILDKLGYGLVRRLKDDRGEGIDTVYFVKKEENDR